MENILIKPLITEKSLLLASKGLYTFVVLPKSNKPQVARAVEKRYNVTVTGVQTVSMHGKTRKVGRKMMMTKRPDWKKAIVRLPKGQKIDAFEVTEQKNEKEKA